MNSPVILSEAKDPSLACTADGSQGSFHHRLRFALWPRRTQLESLANLAIAIAPTQLLDSRDERTIRHHIIAFRFHHYHEIVQAFHIEQYFSIAFSFQKQCVQVVNS